MSKKQGLKGYEQVAEYLMNGEKDKARALFHDIVVETSREIYENLIDDSDFAAISNDQTDDLITDISQDVASDEVMDSVEAPVGLGSLITAEDAKKLLDWLDGTVTESEGDAELLEKVAGFYGVQKEGVRDSLEENTDQLLDLAYGSVNEQPGDPAMDPAAGAMDAPVDDEMGMDDMGDMSDDPVGDVPVDDMGGEGELEDRVMDLEDALDELKAEFDHLMSQEMGEPEHADMDVDGDGEVDVDDAEAAGGDDMGGDDMGGDDMGGDDVEVDNGEEDEGEEEVEEPKESVSKPVAKSASDLMREYVEKVTAPANSEGQGVGDKGKEASVNTKSTVAGKNDMGGTAKNLVKGGSNPAPDGTSAPKSDKPDNLPHAGKFENVPGAKAGKTFSAAKKPVSTEPSGVNKRSPFAK